MTAIWMGIVVLVAGAADAVPQAASTDRALADEVRALGWIAYSARSDKGDWDIFVCRPDGSQIRNLTGTPGHNEFSPQFSRDARRLLYRRMPRTETIDNNHHGTQGELVLANSDGTEPQVFGAEGEYPWASWSPDGRQLACLAIKGITFIDVATKQVVRRWERKGFFQQLTWSPDGRWLSGVANSFGAGWSVARMDAESGAANAVNRVDCCTPDWFPDSKHLVFSWRPPGQAANNGYGWTQLWMADVEGRSRRLLYAEDGRHVYGGHVSPDGKYVLFTGNMQEDGDPSQAGAPMGLMRLRDAPLIGGASRELRKLHPRTGDGPVLTLPMGWEPCWTSSELPAGKPARSGSLPSDSRTILVSTQATPETGNDASRLAAELHNLGWLAFSAKTGPGDWDLFVMRPDGSGRRRLTETRDCNEAGVRFSPDGRQMLYYRFPRTEPVDNNSYGTYELVVARSDGSRPTSLGQRLHWASWGPEPQQLTGLAEGQVGTFDLATGEIVRRLPRRGLVQQTVVSPDGQWLAGTANGLGAFWNIGRLSLADDSIRAIGQADRYNCTPDWMPDSRSVLYARGIVPEVGGFAELWIADATSQRMLYAEADRHIYGACASPDGAYLLFTRSRADMGGRDSAGAELALIRMADAPMIGGVTRELAERHPAVGRGPRLDLGPGWEPHWTLADLSLRRVANTDNEHP